MFEGLQRNLREEVLKILLTITPSEAAAEDVTDGEEYESELTKMAEGQVEKGVNEISKGERNLDDEFKKKPAAGGTTVRLVRAGGAGGSGGSGGAKKKKSGSKKNKSGSKKKSKRK